MGLSNIISSPSGQRFLNGLTDKVTQALGAGVPAQTLHDSLRGKAKMARNAEQRAALLQAAGLALDATSRDQAGLITQAGLNNRTFTPEYGAQSALGAGAAGVQKAEANYQTQLGNITAQEEAAAIAAAKLKEEQAIAKTRADAYAAQVAASSVTKTPDKKPFNISWRDPETGRDEVQAAIAGPNGPMLQNDAGEWVDAFEVTGTHNIQTAGKGDAPAVETGAGGIPNASSYNPTLKTPTFTLNTGEKKAYQYAMRAITANKELIEMESKIDTKKLSSLYAGLGNWARNNATTSISAAVLNKYMGDAGLQEYARDMSRFLQAVLRTDTGAAYTGTEIADYIASYGFVPGQPINENTLADLQKGRMVEVLGTTSGAGPAATYLQGLISGLYQLPSFNSFAMNNPVPKGNITKPKATTPKRKPGSRAGVNTFANTTASGIGWSIK